MRWNESPTGLPINFSKTSRIDSARPQQYPLSLEERSGRHFDSLGNGRGTPAISLRSTDFRPSSSSTRRRRCLARLGRRHVRRLDATDAQSRPAVRQAGQRGAAFGANSRLHQIERLTLPTQEQIAAEVLRTHEGIVHAVEDGDKAMARHRMRRDVRISRLPHAHLLRAASKAAIIASPRHWQRKLAAMGLRVLYLARDGQDEYDAVAFADDWNEPRPLVSSGAGPLSWLPASDRGAGRLHRSTNSCCGR